MISYLDRLFKWVYHVVGTAKFFVFTLALLAFQAIWLAFSAIYPMPYDEYVHVGLIWNYAHRWSPFIAKQPPGTGLFGDITREPSYLYHYLMSFPYRVLDTFIDNQTVLIVSMRLINVAFVVGGLILFRRLLLSWGLSRRLTHAVLLVFVCTPMVPFLAAHVNYDNLMFLLTPVVLGFATRLIRGRPQWLGDFLGFVTFGLLTSLIKHNFLPLFAAAALYVVVVLYLRYRKSPVAAVQKSWRQLHKSISLLLCALLFVVVSGLAIERYGGNLARYGTIWPDCAQVQPKALCRHFGPWFRNYKNIQSKPADALYGNPASFSQYWVGKMMKGFFIPFSHLPTRVVSSREPYGPIVERGYLLGQWVAACTLLVAGMAAVIWQWRRLWANVYLRFALVANGFYLATLWFFNYRLYLRLGKPQAIQARYTYPVLIITFVLIAQALSWTLANKPRVRHAALTVSLVLLCFGGGISAWVIRSDNLWYWQNPTVQAVNQRAQQGLRLVIPR